MSQKLRVKIVFSVGLFSFQSFLLSSIIQFSGSASLIRWVEIDVDVVFWAPTDVHQLGNKPNRIIIMP